ncbi:hypothetical protein FJY70_00055 [candidate division WOR-3 bacterium]|nr:hypothetical protein [candidate division WOR-3 bacterium]
MKSLLSNRKSRTTGLLLVLLAMLTGSAPARTARPAPAGQRVYDMEWLNINKWRCPFHNDGRYGYDPTTGSGHAGGSWPQPLKNFYIFGAGLWFGSIKVRADNPEKEDTLVTFGYNPNSGGTEMSPVVVEHAEDGTGSPDDRVFVYPTDWPPEPRERWVTVPELDSLVPKENFSLMDMWCAYSDILPENHISPGKPQYINVYQTVYAWNYPSNQDIFFIIYNVRNAGTDTLKNCYMGAVCDPDIGDAADDMVGLLLNSYVPGADTVRNVGYVGDNNNAENPGSTWETGTPGVFAYKFLDSPKRDSITPTGDTVKLPIGMTAFKKFTIDIDPVTDAAQYLTMAGFDYRTGVFSPYDSVDAAPADKRFVQCSGPFTLAPGQMERLVIACIGAPYGGPGQDWQNRPVDSLVHLAKLANQAQFIYDAGWLLPGPPLAPNLTLVPGDNQVRIVWDNLPERTPDPYWVKVASDPNKPGYDTLYRGYDFEGYMVYKSRNGTDWQILAQCDLANSLTFSYPPGGDSAATPDSLWIKATDAGLFYSYRDTNVLNGFTYYYCVAAYDWNLQTNIDTAQNRTRDTLILRSGLVSNFTTIPRWDAVNYLLPTTRVVTAVGDTLKPGLKWLTNVVVPAQVTSDTYELRFLGPAYGGGAGKSIYRYIVTNRSNKDSVVLDTASFDYTVGNKLARALPVFNGIALNCTLRLTTPGTGFEAATVVTGDYPPEKLRGSGTAGQGAWAFRAADYEVEFAASPYLTAKVYDVTHGRIEVPFTKFDNLSGTKENADGWCFVDRTAKNPTDTLLGRTVRIYCCGAYAEVNAGDSIGANTSLIQNGDRWLLVGNKTGGTAPFYNQYHVLSNPGVARTDTTYKLNVKVVPNPYIVFNAWEKTSEQRYVRFTHLPNECTIRIFTLSGDLVKVIRHKDTKNQPLDQGGTETWDFTNESPGSAGTAISGQLVASGVYIYHVESPVGEAVGKLVFIY